MAGNSPKERDGLCEGSPLRPQPTPTGSVFPVPGPPGDQPPPPDAPPGYFDGGRYQTTSTYHHRRGSPSLAKIIIGGVVIFLVLMNAIRLSKLERARLEKQREELEDKRKMLENERQMWKDERLALKEERERWKKARKDRGPQGAFWESVLPAEACLSYGKREYWGVLRNIPEGWTEINACMNMPVEIKGVSIRRPHRCHYVEGSPHIHGFWMVDWDQLDCKPWHQDFNDKVSLAQSWVSHFSHSARLTLIPRVAQIRDRASIVLKPGW